MSEIIIDYAGFRFLANYEYSPGEIPAITHLFICKKDSQMFYLGNHTDVSFEFIYDSVPGLFEKLEQAIEKEEERRKDEQENTFSLGS